MNRRLTVHCAALLATLAWCGGVQPAPVDPVRQATLGHWQLSLHDHAGRCQLHSQAPRSPRREVLTAIPWPCSFHIDRRGAVRVLQHKGQSFALVESALVVDPSNCVTHLQAVRATRASVKLSESHDRVASCPPFQWDDMLFTALFK